MNGAKCGHGSASPTRQTCATIAIMAINLIGDGGVLCVCACVHAYVGARACACVCVCVRACVRACVGVRVGCACVCGGRVCACGWVGVMCLLYSIIIFYWYGQLVGHQPLVV